jgi:hypothetical protein
MGEWGFRIEGLWWTARRLRLRESESSFRILGSGAWRFRIWRWPKRTMRWKIAMTISTKPRRRTGPNRSGGRGRSHARNCRASRGRSEPPPDLLSKVGDGRIADFGCLHCGGMKSVVWAGERQASVSLQGVPEDIRSVDGNVVCWITLQRPLDGASRP